MATVIQVPFFFANATTSAFYLGETLQQMTDAAFKPKANNSCCVFSSEKAKVSVGPSMTIASLYEFSLTLSSSLILLVNSSSESLVSITTFISVCISLQLFPISIAVSYLSPVSTHTLIFVSIIFAIESDTPSCNLSSIAVDPT